MKWKLATAALVLTVLLATGQARAFGRFDAPLAGRVFAAALTFTVPRALDATTPAELALWGLGGIAALDSDFAASQRGHFVQLLLSGRPLYVQSAPKPDDADGWGHLAALLNKLAYESSPKLRQAGGQALIQSFFDAMFGHLDPYSRYVPPAPAEAARDRLSVDAGAGFSLLRQKDGLAVADVVPGGPGTQAGVRVGDRLLAVDGVSMRGRSQTRVQAMLTGEEGAVRRLRLRGLDGVTRTLPLTLAYVPPETVFTSRSGGLLVLRVTAFDGNTAERLSQAIEAGMAREPSAAMVLDLRGNRGGLLRQAVTAVALFAEQGVIASTAGRNPDATHDWRIDGGGDLTHGARLILLVDGRTASAAEIMAAALADLGRAVVIGSSTLGKGLVQTIASLPDGGEIYVTWSRVLAPRGWPIQTLGVMPQICTSRGEASLRHQMDGLEDGHNEMAPILAQTRNARPPLAQNVALALRQACPASDGGDLDVSAAQQIARRPKAFEAALLH